MRITSLPDSAREMLESKERRGADECVAAKNYGAITVVGQATRIADALNLLMRLISLIYTPPSGIF